MTTATRIGLLGGESTGKSTVATLLRQRVDACVVPEALRDFVERHGRTPRADEQAALLRAQQSAEDDLARACASGLVVADPAPLMTAIYSVAYFEDDSLLAEGVAQAHRYAVLGWCRPDFAWVPDEGQRDGPQHRAQVDALIGEVVRERLRPAGITVLELTGPAEQRTDVLERAWHRPGHEGPT